MNTITPRGASGISDNTVSWYMIEYVAINKNDNVSLESLIVISPYILSHNDTSGPMH